MADDDRTPGVLAGPQAVETTALIRYAVVAELMFVRSGGLAAAGIPRWADSFAFGLEPIASRELAPGAPVARPRGPGEGPLELPAESAPVEGDDRHWTDQGL